ncbi:hypothetical protein B9Z19DRAFT_1036342 [Tuber borchii]|uniref:Uncharacterized protein n=1 Tax=Tuber borchii TaxID=42251 RepID=A0A2T6ZB58_TUBBO|nr:hypothetical protein B9Z19DRAFT_1036342 [Tuber borchii]
MVTHVTDSTPRRPETHVSYVKCRFTSRFHSNLLILLFLRPIAHASGVTFVSSTVSG